jgi:hypothetical protein
LCCCILAISLVAWVLGFGWTGEWSDQAEIRVFLYIICSPAFGFSGVAYLKIEFIDLAWVDGL